MRFSRREFLAQSLAAAALSAVQARASAEPGDPTARRFDVCIIGSGFAGTLLGLQTAAAGLRTVVVEAATLPDDSGRGESVANSFRSTNSGSTSYNVDRSRLIAVGGTSNHWSGVVTRMRPVDLRQRSEFGQSVDWPISYGDLEPYYCRSEQILSVSGHAPVEGVEPPRSCPYPEQKSAAQRSPRVVLDGRALRFFPVARSSRSGGPVRLVEREVPRFAAAEAATLLTGLQATRLVTEDGSSVDHVELRSVTGGLERVEAREFVVAAGVIETPRLLLLSQSRWFPRGIGNGNDLVGRYFVTHPAYRWGTRMVPADSVFPVGASFTAFRTDDFADAFARKQLNACSFQMESRAGDRFVWKAQPEIEPRPENRVSLSGTVKDPRGIPVPDIHFGYSSRDLRTRAEAERILGAQRRALGIRRRSAQRSDVFRWHPSGACRMGFDADSGVVDSNLKVFGMRNLYLSGAAVFPTAGTANPTNTVVALALRLADHLISKSR